MPNAPIKTNEEYSVSHCSVIVTVHGAPRLWKPVKLGSPSSSGVWFNCQRKQRGPISFLYRICTVNDNPSACIIDTYYVAHILLILPKQNAIYSRINSQKCGSSANWKDAIVPKQISQKATRDLNLELKNCDRGVFWLRSGPMWNAEMSVVTLLFFERACSYIFSSWYSEWAKMCTAHR